MNIIKKNFSIKDLENLSGIKAHTIRIWEKRYGLLTPDRTETNIRYYSLKNLQKLLNITLLYNNGYKISKIAKVSEEKIPMLVREIVSENSTKSHAINAFKLAMINFDLTLFYNTYNSLINTKTFREIFHEIFIPLLTELGYLWQTNTISIAHEHFVTNLIKQKILLNTEKLQVTEPVKKGKPFVLFLPDNEIHEIGLLYLNYEIILRGHKSIYLGSTVPIDGLVGLLKYHPSVNFITYFTVSPDKDSVTAYVHEFHKQISDKNDGELWILGTQAKYIESEYLPEEIKVFDDIDIVLDKL